MNQIKAILVIVDPTAAEQPAVTKAAMLAEKFHARIDLFVCDAKASRAARLAKHVQEQPGEVIPADSNALLEGLAAKLRARNIEVTAETRCADPLHIALAEHLHHTCADLVVKDTHHHSLAQRTFMTNTDWTLIRSCPVPLLLTKAKTWRGAPRVFAAIDPGHVNDKPAELDNRILEHASMFAKKLGGELHAVHAYVPIAVIAAATGGAPPMAMSVSAEELKAEATEKRRELDELVAQYDVAPANVHLEVGGPGDLLPRIAQKLAADILVMGVISRTGLKRVFIGVTAEDVLERLPCDALIVKPADFGAAMSF